MFLGCVLTEEYREEADRRNERPPRVATKAKTCRTAQCSTIFRPPPPFPRPLPPSHLLRNNSPPVAPRDVSVGRAGRFA
eukprot:5318722-Pyramimonas_sp.AAC.1